MNDADALRCDKCLWHDVCPFDDVCDNYTPIFDPTEYVIDRGRERFRREWFAYLDYILHGDLYFFNH